MRGGIGPYGTGKGLWSPKAISPTASFLEERLASLRWSGRYPEPSEDSVEGIILDILRVNGSMITRDLRSACGFDGSKMRSRFDSYITRLQMACRVVTEDFVYPQDKHGNRYGWGWALLNTPEQLFGHEACFCERSPEESLERIMTHLHEIIPYATEKQLKKLIL